MTTLITTDGLRWQEVFTGAEKYILKVLDPPGTIVAGTAPKSVEK